MELSSHLCKFWLKFVKLATLLLFCVLIKGSSNIENAIFFLMKIQIKTNLNNTLENIKISHHRHISTAKYIYLHVVASWVIRESNKPEFRYDKFFQSDTERKYFTFIWLITYLLPEFF